MNRMIEADIYGNVNSSHIMGSSIYNGIAGFGDFPRNAYIAMFLTPSTAKNGEISCIATMVSHVDHTEHDVHVIVYESRASPTCAASRRSAAPSRSSTTARIPITGRAATTSTARLHRPRQAHPPPAR